MSKCMSFVLVVISLACCSTPSSETQEASLDLVRVPAGKFLMGDPSLNETQPVREVTISHDFLMGKYEVTNELFCKVINYLIDSGDFKVEKQALWNTITKQ